MIVTQSVVVHLVSRTLRAFGVVRRVPFFTLHQMWLHFPVALRQYVGHIHAPNNQWPNKEDKQQRIKNNVELVR